MNSEKSTPINKEPQQTVTKNSLNGKTRFDAKIYINTLLPDFSYLNAKGETLTPKKCEFL